MKLHSLDMPDNPADLPRWLERQLVGAHLRELVGELTAVHGSTSTLYTLDEVLGEDRDRLLRHGLTAVPVPKLRRLLVQPRLLLELQEVACRDGGPFWSELAATDGELSQSVSRGRSQVNDQLFAASKAAASPRADVVPISRAIRWTSNPWLVSLATAAALLLAVTLFEFTRLSPKKSHTPVSAGWGWNRPDSLAAQGSAADYLNRLADAADEWFLQRPEEATALARRIGELRQGCSMLIFAEHRPLDETERQWLVEKCRAWAAKLDQHLVALESGEDPLDVRGRADETVRKLVEAMRNRSAGKA